MGQKNALYFCAGLAIGILGTLGFLWFYQEPDTEQNDTPEEAEPEPTVQEKPVTDGRSTIDDFKPVEQTVDYAAFIANTVYAKGANQDNTPKPGSGEPRRVTEEQFEDGNIEGHYDICGLTVYGDGILANAVTDEILDEPDAFAVLGPNYTAAKLHEIFARAQDYTDDPIWIRNDNLFTQYEITYDKRTYKEVTGLDPNGT